MSGHEESHEPGYSLTEIQDKVTERRPVLELDRSGRYVWSTGTSTNEGTWRVEDSTLILRDDVSNGNTIQPALRSDREWRIDSNGDFVSDSPYGYYGVEMVYSKQ